MTELLGSIGTYYFRQVVNGKPMPVATIETGEALGYFRMTYPLK